MNKKIWWRLVLSVFLFPFGLVSASHAGETTVRLRGTLAAEACLIAPEDKSLEVDFGTIVDKALYQYQRWISQTFTIHLINCDVQLGNYVQVTFKGDESTALPGMLAVSPAEMGIAIGIETTAGQKILINRDDASGTYVQSISNGTSTLAFRGWVQGEPQSLSDKTVQKGAFNAVATFELAYY